MNTTPAAGALAEPPRMIAGPAGQLAVYEQSGEGLPLILVHGVNMRAAVWADVAAALPNRRVVALDLRGHGLSSHVGPFSVDDYVADVRAVTAALSIERAQYAGVSFGALIACIIAQETPDAVQSVVAFGSALRGTHPDLEGGMRRLRRVGVAQYFHSAFNSEASGDPNAARLVSLAVAGRENVDLVEAVTRAGFTTDLQGRVAVSGRPVRVINGELDGTCTPEAGQALAAASGGTLQIIPGAGHVLPLERPRLCATLISASAD